jgi:hypothetical protein
LNTIVILGFLDEEVAGRTQGKQAEWARTTVGKLRYKIWLPLGQRTPKLLLASTTAAGKVCESLYDKEPSALALLPLLL